MKTLKLAVLGLSEGNGHPYSWSAICNGYNVHAMARSGYPVISQYLSERSFPDDAIVGAKVTCVWTQDAELSRTIADAALIENVLDTPEDAIGQVDGVLLARDDAQTHLDLARPFLDVGLPVYIDKPLAYDVETARRILDLQQWPGQVFSCSALRYADEFNLSAETRDRLGALRHVHGVVPKSWRNYGVHAIEPALVVLAPQGEIVRNQCWREGGVVTVNIAWQDGKQATFTAVENGAAPIRLSFVGAQGHETRTFQDSFSAFKTTLEVFIDSVRDREEKISPEFVLNVVRIIEYGCK